MPPGKLAIVRHLLPLACWLACAGCFVQSLGSTGGGSSDGGGAQGAGDIGGSGATTAQGAGPQGGEAQGAGPQGGAAQGGAGGAGGGVGDCVIAAPEICDDCNMVAGDGCSASGAIEDGWACPTEGQACLHFSGFDVTQQEAISLGGPNGGAFSDPCAPGSAIVGFEGQWDGTVLKGAAAHCAPLRVTNDGRVGWTGPPIVTSFRGGGGTPIGAYDCPMDQLVVGFHVNVESSAGMQIRGFDLQCAPFVFDGQAVKRGAVTTLPHYGGVGGNDGGSAACAGDEIAIAHTGYAGGRLDRLGVTCASTTPTFCGDLMKQGFEGCDDGNAVSGDTCSTVCQTE